jgi:hypothetical protein
VRRFGLLLLVLLVALPPGRAAAAGPPLGGFLEGPGDSGTRPYLSRCSFLHGPQKIWNCYVTRLLAEVEKSGDPAHELPRIDLKVRAAGGYLESACHMMMHQVGREYARRHHITLANLQRYLPRSNDPGCSAGFGMGMVMTLGSAIGQLGPNGAVKLCLKAPTRFRSYTCIHTLGHAYMRLYHGHLAFGVRACEALPPEQAPDCAQGAYHDYWLGIAGRDSAKRGRHAITSPRVLCARAIKTFVRPCWFRYFLELPPQKLPEHAAGVLGLCHGLAGLQREGCVGAASLITSADPFIQIRVCARMHWRDAASCVYGLNAQDLSNSRGSQRVKLIENCSLLPRKARSRCYEWLGTALSVVTNGRFRELACPFIGAGRDACTAGAMRMNDALVTFS